MKNVIKWIKGHTGFLITIITQSIAIIGLVCGFAALFILTFSGENAIWWILFLDLPLLVFVIWVWVKAIIPWTFKAIDLEHNKYIKDNEKAK